MKWIVAATLLLAPAAGAVETVRILMGEVRGDVAVRAPELASGEDTEDDAARPWSRLGESASVRASGGGVELSGRPSGRAVRFRSGRRGATLRVGDWEVAGEVVVRVAGARLQLINVLPLEDYLAGVLGAEMPPKFPPEALRAQAVAARTYALHKKLEQYGQPFHLGSSVIHQVYRGLQHEDPRARAAVEATRGEVLTYALAPIEAYFHASCGGRTESGRDALQRDLPYLQSVGCPCGDDGHVRWALTLTDRELAELTSSGGRGLQVASRSPSGRARSLRVGRGAVDAVSFRRQVGYERVKSLAFEVEPRGHAVHLSGKGFGHGAGLCQQGARILAERGSSYGEILGHYYPGTELQRLY